MTEQAMAEPRLPEAPYAFRPAKRIQRMMFCDALRSLRLLRPLEEYQYVGFGHWQFVDFELMRREVGVREMYSIERNTNERARFEENLPFEEIRLLFDTASACLQGDEIDLSKPTIAWLDYTAPLENSILQDLRLLVEQVPIGSVVAATFNCHPGKEDERLETLERRLEVPGDVSEEDLDRNGLPKVQRRVLVEQLEAAVHTRGDSANLAQFMFVRYREGRAPMAFWAGLVGDDSEPIARTLETLARHEQFSSGEEFLDVSVPHLSTREVIALNKSIREGEDPSIRGVPEPERAAYVRLHRWYPPIPLPL